MLAATLMAGCESAKTPQELVAEAKQYRSKGEWQAAATDYDQVAKVKPDYPNLDYLRGFVHSSAGNLDISRDLLQKVVAKNPENSEALASLGYVLLEMGNYAEAEKVLQKAIALDGANVGALYDYSRLDIKRRNYASAVKYLERVTQLDRINPQAYYQLFLAYSRLKQTDKANTALAEFKRLDALEKQSKSERQLDEKLRAAQLLGGQ